ncbi:phosphatidylinositol-3-phosphatase SAC1-B-like [Lytechinus variegatus]|uniref:phosphatidylinositol-3-phosphatase SAC1-B-like n=1 Tax=Lytechinus variegatus TaxID=7654 RepID=UPI001BB1735E|nr:phosphatidylinositol-3-phosphatase SAC1-B-like [Lytechinus variegatus]
MSVHETLLIHTQDDKFFIEARDPGTKEVLVIDRLSQEIILEENGINIPPGASSKPICGIMGIIKLLRGSYLVIITKKEKVGEINGQAIWKISGTESIPYKKTDLHLTEEQKQDNKVYESMVQYALENNTYYFSTTFDLTHSLQRLYNTSPEFLQMPLFERADQRFVWNGHMLREFTAQPELGKFILPVMVGFISIRIGIINTKRFDYILISRRSCLRAGTRFYMRGLDEQGQAANFVETEQIVQFNGSRASFVQTRGSIPLFWSQRPNLKYKPTPQISESQSHLDAFKRHFDDQVVNYGNQVLINLIDHKGVEDRLEKMFAKTVYDSGNQMMRYESFDFHHECRKMRWDRLSILMDKLAKDQQQFGYFWMDANNELLKHQVGVFRTNCMDCLDRTNVVQSMLARRALQDQMQQMGILKQGESLENHYNSAFESTFKNTWADNADACSKQYAGTGALKTDFTRTGKRTKLGLMKDGLNSMIRYYMNNFVDGFRQDSTDLLLGNYVVEENEGVSRPSPIRKSKDAKFMLLPAIAMVAFSMLLISMLIPAAELHLQIAYILFWLAATIICVGLMGVFGMEFVDQPKLSQAKVKSD